MNIHSNVVRKFTSAVVLMLALLCMELSCLLKRFVQLHLAADLYVSKQTGVFMVKIKTEPGVGHPYKWV